MKIFNEQQKINITRIWNSEYKNILHCDNSVDFMDNFNFINRELYLDVITPKIADFFNNMIRIWNQMDREIIGVESKPIKIFINSTGGNFNAMLLIMDAIKLSKTPIYTIVSGIAQKQAFFVFLAGHKKFMYPSASLLYSQNMNILDNVDTILGNTITFNENQNLELKNFLLDRTAINEGLFDKFSKSNNWYFNSEEALKYKICNKIVQNLSELIN